MCARVDTGKENQDKGKGKHISDSPALSDFVTELAYSMLKSFTPQMGITIEDDNIFVYI